MMQSLSDEQDLVDAETREYSSSGVSVAAYESCAKTIIRLKRAISFIL